MPPQPPLNSDGQNGEKNAATFVSSMLHLQGPFFSFLFLAPFLPAPFSFINEAAQYRHFPLSVSVFNTGDAPPVFALRRGGDRAGWGVTRREEGRPWKISSGNNSDAAAEATALFRLSLSLYSASHSIPFPPLPVAPLIYGLG